MSFFKELKELLFFKETALSWRARHLGLRAAFEIEEALKILAAHEHKASIHSRRASMHVVKNGN